MMRTGAAVFLSILLGAAGLTRAAVAVPSPDRPDPIIEKAMKDWEVPGLALVVVRGGEAPRLLGYGTRHHGEDLKIDARTFLQIASNTKTFTAFAIGMLVDDGKLRWDDPIRKFIPELELPDPYVADNVAIDDLLCHRSGLTGAVPGGFQRPGFGLAEALKDVKKSELANRFRAHNNYSQVGLGLLGEVVARVTGTSWEEFVRQRILVPLGMRSTYTSNGDFSKRVGAPDAVANIMKPAVKKGGQVVDGSWADVGTGPFYAPAGGIISTMEDLARWMSFRATDGVHAGTRLISEASLEEIRRPRIPADFSGMGISLSHIHPRASLVLVGHGQYSFEHRGRRTIVHNGGWMSSVIAVVPDQDLAVGVFSNAWFDEPSPWASLAFVNAVALSVLDKEYGYDDVDWSSEMLRVVKGR